MSDSENSVDSGESTRFSSDEDTEEAVGLMVAGVTSEQTTPHPGAQLNPTPSRNNVSRQGSLFTQSMDNFKTMRGSDQPEMRSRLHYTNRNLDYDGVDMETANVGGSYELESDVARVVERVQIDDGVMDVDRRKEVGVDGQRECDCDKNGAKRTDDSNNLDTHGESDSDSDLIASNGDGHKSESSNNNESQHHNDYKDHGNASDNHDQYELYDEDEDEDEDDSDLPVEQRLLGRLMSGYERSVRPVRNASDIVEFRMGLTLTQIFDMDEKNQVLVTNVWLDQEWRDVFLTWEPADYEGLRVLRLPCHKLWLPDIVLYNNAADYSDGLMPAHAMITHEGGVFWPVPAKLRSSCKVDVTYFPFDHQTCRLKFGSWTYDGFQVDMFNRTTEVDLSNYVENGEWELLGISIERNVVYYACCDEPFPDVTFIVHIRRRTIYYLYNVLFPCVMMSALTLLVFCLPPDSGEKITMGITVLLAFSVFLLRMGEDLPETSEFIPLLSIYLTIVMALTSISVILTVFVLNLHYRGPDTAPVPRWLRACCPRTTLPAYSHRWGSSHGLFTKHPSFMDEFTRDDSSSTTMRYTMNKRMSLKMTIENLAQELKDELDGCGGGEEPQCTLVGRSKSSKTYSTMHPPSKSIYRTNEQILSALKKIIERYERDDLQDSVLYEWRQVAAGVDRILFWVFLLATTTSTVIVLVVAPITGFI